MTIEVKDLKKGDKFKVDSFEETVNNIVLDKNTTGKTVIIINCENGDWFRKNPNTKIKVKR